MRLRRPIGQLMLVLALVLCFGLAGLLWLLPSWRRSRVRRAARCTTCRRKQSVGRATFLTWTVLLCAGALTRAHASIDPPIRCHSHVSAAGQVRPEPLLELARAGSPAWNAARRIVVAPTSGVALLASDAAGLERCAGPPLLVTFHWPPRVSGGSTVGDVFVTWIPAQDDGYSPSHRLPGTGLAAETGFVRFGPNISSRRTSEEELGRHEARHSDQWAVATLAGGPLAFPVAYYVDSLFFPVSRSHFERAAGLADGGYDPPPDAGPAPLWGPIALLCAVLAIAQRTRLRLLSRALAHGRSELAAADPHRCPRHTAGWFRRRPQMFAGAEPRAHVYVSPTRRRR